MTRQDDEHEQLSGGVGSATTGSRSNGETTTTVRIAPLPEGERTTGQSGKATIWDREPLKRAVESGALDGTTIIKGEGGENPHFPMSEQVPPENIIGRVDSWTYEEGVGPVGETDIVDEQMARRIDAGLLEVSPDLHRHLGEFDDERDGHPVEEIIGMPRATVLERGAARNASIETFEALGFNPDGNAADDLAESEDEGDGDGDDGAGESGSDEEAEPSTGSGDDNGDSNKEMSDSDSGNAMERIGKLEEQLAAAESRAEEAEERASELESETEELQEEVETKEEVLESKDEEIETREERIERLETETEHLRRRFALEATGGNESAADMLVDSEKSMDDLAQSAAEAKDLSVDVDGDDDRPYAVRVEEQLAASPDTRGDSPSDDPDDPDSGGGSGNLTEEQLAAADDMAYGALAASDLRSVDRDEPGSARERAKQKTGVDPAECDSKSEFERRVAEAQREDGN